MVIAVTDFSFQSVSNFFFQQIFVIFYQIRVALSNRFCADDVNVRESPDRFEKLDIKVCA